ncbi:MAG: hypothetical protein CO093_02455 [Alphaproteobacteria bacterium CG_4_9_14_3_um_filter_47_13]|nr:MAG: hypothetical protein CO093_02455 [Alphaproteobacteria bacterium CG_4_9_14_3_um_filter_47_13]
MFKVLPTKIFPVEITSYDLLKTFAIIFMVIDHTGYYFFPDESWWRVAGRLCVPVWFFLIGYARSRDTGSRLWIGALILVTVYLLAGSHFIPFNILITIIILRLIIDPLMKFSQQGIFHFTGLCFISFLLIIPTSYGVEYGTQGIILAMAGYYARHYQKMGLDKIFVRNFMIFSSFFFVIPQFLLHGFSLLQFYVLFSGIAAVYYWLYHFSSTTHPVLTAKLSPAISRLIKFTGRRTLEIYVAHIVLFQVIALLERQERFGLFEWKLMPQF